MTEETSTLNLIELATELTTAWLANPNTRASAEDVPAFLGKMHETVTGLASPTAVEEPAAVQYTPAVPIRRSLASKDHLLSLIDGKPYKTLKKHLSGHGLTPAEYRERYGLKSDYPMVAEGYAEMRRDLAKKIGLGRKPGTKVPAKPAAKAAAKTNGKSETAAAPTSAAKTSAEPAVKSAAVAKPKAAAQPKAATKVKAAPKPKTEPKAAPKPKAAPAATAAPAEAAAES